MSEQIPAAASARGADCVVIGAGPSGLACAVRLARRGLTVQVLEGATTPGGRVRGGLFQGEPADIGFQTILRGYPTVGEFMSEIGVGTGDLHTFERRIVVHDGTKWRRLKMVGPGSVATSGAASRGDIVRAVRLAARAAVGGTKELDGGQHESAAELFADAGISERAVDLLLRPLLGSMLLDRTLESDAGYVRFLLGMMARGPAVLPVDGIGMIIDRAVETLTRSGGMLWTGTPVARINQRPGGNATGVTLGDGRTVNAASVVLAVGANAARDLLQDIDPVAAARVPAEPAGAISATFALERPLYDDATLLLDAAAPEGTHRVDLVCQTTNVTRPGSPGPHILVAQSATAGWRDVSEGRYADAVLARLRTLILGYDWGRGVTLVNSIHQPDALYRVTPGVRANLPGHRTAVRNLVLAGDITTHPSLEGAVSAGFRAAETVADTIL